MLRASMSGQQRGLFGNRKQLIIVTIIFAAIFFTNLIVWPNKLEGDGELADYSRSPLGNLHRNHDPEGTAYLALQKLIKQHKLKGKDDDKMKWRQKEKYEIEKEKQYYQKHRPTAKENPKRTETVANNDSYFQEEQAVEKLKWETSSSLVEETSQDYSKKEEEQLENSSNNKTSSEERRNPILIEKWKILLNNFKLSNGFKHGAEKLRRGLLQ